jgi:hypothetical protein
MIPYYVQNAFPNDDMRNSNIHIEHGCIEREKLNEKIISIIIEFMNDFCCEDSGHDIKITSYKDFCEKFWEIAEYKISGWYYVFNICYFEDKWIEWDIEKYQHQIYNEYLHTNM